MEKLQLHVHQYPRFVQEFAKENFNLKTLCGVLMALMFINAITLALLLHKGPIVIPIAADGTVARVGDRITDAQIQSAIREYLSTRYAWTDSTISSQLKKAEAFVEPNLVSAFQKAMVETTKYVHEKKVTQRVYARSIDVNLKDHSATVLADRISEFDSLKAATEIRLQLSFAIEDRTLSNPWGVYIVKENEKASQ